MYQLIIETISDHNKLFKIELQTRVTIVTTHFCYFYQIFEFEFEALHHRLVQKTVTG